MHNLFLGVAKTQWFDRWIETGALRGNTPQTARELNIVHEFLESAGRLPLRVGEAAGGSLTADEYKFATTGPWAVVIPLVWERFLAEATKDFERAEKNYPAALDEYKKKLASWEAAQKAGKTKSRCPREPKAPFQRMQKGEDNNFLRFATALKILLYGMDKMKPNHHWAVHVPDQVLKNLNTNNWGGGLLEVSMMREFHRMAQLDGMVRN
ncbi:hypothetical protein B0H14DRAFT_3093052 [Mycena olivaceomarginata]|nr:hypothetical protein B0H14DRAFT_3093052 [Mycena olivaceomarginata]